jgi:hypothetical protein
MSVFLRVFGVAAIAAGSLVTGCGTQPSPPGGDPHGDPHRDPPRAPARDPARDPAPNPPRPPATLTSDLVDQAFGGVAPAFPLIASNGNQVTMGIASPIGGSVVATYRVITFSNWTNMSDAWGSNAVEEPIVDATMTTMLLDRAMGEPAPLPDPRLLAERGAAIRKRLLGGGFTPFDGPAIAIGGDDTAVGPVKLRTAHGADAELIVRLLDAGDPAPRDEPGRRRHVRRHAGRPPRLVRRAPQARPRRDRLARRRRRLRPARPRVRHVAHAVDPAPVTPGPSRSPARQPAAGRRGMAWSRPCATRSS